MKDQNEVKDCLQKVITIIQGRANEGINQVSNNGDEDDALEKDMQGTIIEFHDWLHGRWSKYKLYTIYTYQNIGYTNYTLFQLG